MGVYVVGCGGQPNSRGVIQCDAALMDGNGLRFGAVAAIEGFVCTCVPRSGSIVSIN